MLHIPLIYVYLFGVKQIYMDFNQEKLDITYIFARLITSDK